MLDIYLIAFSFFLSCIITLYAVPSIIKLAYQKRLFDDPAVESRKIHKYRTPNIGGIAVLTSFAFTACLFISGYTLPYANYIFASGVLIFSVGLKDDLAALNPYKKFVAQLITAFIVVFLADIRLTSFYGVFGIHEIHAAVSYAFSSLLVVFIINAFNLIDGINGLLGSISLIVSVTFGLTFFMLGEYGLTLLAASLAGSILGFLRYNVGRARIFMGDAGAYTIGFMVSVLTIQFVEINAAKQLADAPITFTQSVPAVAIAILIIPIFDTLRVIALRVVRGKSPFEADRNHLHHRLLDNGMSHNQVTFTLAAVNLLYIGVAFGFQHIGTVDLLILTGILTLILNTLLWLFDVRKATSIETAPAPAVQEAHQPNLYTMEDQAHKLAQEAIQQLEEEAHKN